MSKSDPPAPPDPRAIAGAATSTNIGTGVANSYLNNMNQITREGELRYDKTGSYDWNDPETGRTYNIPRFTATQILGDNQEAQAQQIDQAKYNLANMANTQSERVKGVLGHEMDFSGAPAAGDPTFGGMGDPRFAMGGGYGQQTGTLADTGQQQREFGDAGDITRSYAPDDNWSADRSRVEQSMFDRLNPQLDRERQNLEQRLNDQGIRYGSTAYTQAMDDYSRQSNDMRLAVTAAGGQEQTRMADMAAKAAGFENAAQQQAYTQQQGRGQFYNQAQQADYAQALSSGQFANSAQKDQFAQDMAQTNLYNTSLAQQLQQRQSQFNAQNASRGQYMQEQYAQRNQPLNEIGALLSGSQVSGPNFVNPANSQIATTDIAGLINNRFSQDMDIYKTESANTNALLGGLFGAIGGIGRGVLSDVREKENIRPMGTVFAANEDGGKEPLPVYEYSYKKDPASTRHVGPMAQDVERIDKRAVQTRGGRKYIDTTRLGSILKVA